MRSRSRRVLTGVGLLLAGWVMISGPGTGCADYMMRSALTAADFCFIFDCQNGILGGTIDPCSGTGVGDLSGEDPLFSDCPDFQGP